MFTYMHAEGTGDAMKVKIVAYDARCNTFKSVTVGQSLPAQSDRCPGPSTNAPSTARPADCWTCPAGLVHWALVPNAPSDDRCGCANPNLPTTATPSPATSAAPTQYDTRGCWTCPAGYIHWFQAGYSSAPGGDRCACVPKAPSTTGSPTQYDTRGCWTCPAGLTHWFQAGLTSAPGGDRCACVPYERNGCWTCGPGYIHWFQAGLKVAPNNDGCACVRVARRLNTVVKTLNK